MAKKENLGQKLVAHLKDTGTSASRLKPIESHVNNLKGEVDENGLYEWLESQHVPYGTLKKAGKFLFGPEFCPKLNESHVPTEELEALRVENENLKSQIASMNAERSRMERRHKAEVEDLKHKLNQHELKEPALADA